MASFCRGFRTFARTSARLQGRNITKSKSSAASQGKILIQERCSLLQARRSLVSVSTMRFSAPLASSRLISAAILRTGSLCSGVSMIGDASDMESSNDDEGLLVIPESDSDEEL